MRKLEIVSAFKSLKAKLESDMRQTDAVLTKEEKIKKFKAKFESIVDRQFEEMEKNRIAKQVQK